MVQGGLVESVFIRRCFLFLRAPASTHTWGVLHLVHRATTVVCCQPTRKVFLRLSCVQRCPNAQSIRHHRATFAIPETSQSHEVDRLCLNQFCQCCYFCRRYVCCCCILRCIALLLPLTRAQCAVMCPHLDVTRGLETKSHVQCDT